MGHGSSKKDVPNGGSSGPISDPSSGTVASGSSGPPMKKSGNQKKLDVSVHLHIYDVRGNVAIEYMNTLFRMLGTGAFHVAVEVFGDEWSYGFQDESPGCTGVFNCEPGQNKEYGHHRESIDMGCTQFNLFQVDELLEELCKKWKGEEYDLLQHNCCHFSDDFCQRLGVGHVPQWVMNLASVGSGCKKAANMPLDKIFQLAKAGHKKAGDEAAKSDNAESFAQKVEQDPEAKERAKELGIEESQIIPHATSGKDIVKNLQLNEIVNYKSRARIRGQPSKKQLVQDEPRRCCPGLLSRRSSS